jgi:hypothetical protein
MKFVNFDELNDFLLERFRDHVVSIYEYNWYAYHVDTDPQYITKYMHDDSFISIIRLYIKYINYDIRNFCIPILDLDTIEIKIEDYSSKIPNWFQRTINYDDNSFKKQKRFLKKYKMYDSIDYEMHIENVDGYPVPMGYNISRLALHTLLIKKYGSKIFSLILDKVATILYNFVEYQTLFNSKRIESLNRTIVGFSTDIGELHSTISNMKHDPYLSPITEKDSYDSIPMLGDDDSNSSGDLDDLKKIVKDKENLELTVGTMCELLEELTNNLNRNIDERISVINMKIDKISIALTHFIYSDTDYNCATGISDINQEMDNNNLETKIDNHIEEMKEEYDHIMSSPYINDYSRVSMALNRTEFITTNYENDVCGDNKITERWNKARRTIKSRDRQFTF